MNPPPRYGALLWVISLLALSVFASAQDSQVKRRLTPKEIEALPSENAGRESHFARTGPEGATVSITGYGPTDTVDAK